MSLRAPNWLVLILSLPATAQPIGFDLDATAARGTWHTPGLVFWGETPVIAPG